MAPNPFLEDALRPDQARLTHTHMGLISPIWLPFIAAAGVGAAWWTMTHWARVMGSGYPGLAVPRANGANNGANGAAARPAQPSPQAAVPAEPAPRPAAARAVEALAPEAESLAAGLAEQPGGGALNESLAVQGEAADQAASARTPEPATATTAPKATSPAAPPARTAPPKAEAAAHEPAKVAPRKAEAPAPQPAKVARPKAEAVAPKPTRADPPKTAGKAAETPAKASASAGDDKPAPTLPPHEGLPARRKGGGGRKKAG